MADDARPTSADLTAADPAADPAAAGLTPAPEALDATELLRRLERGGGRFGHAGPPGREPARLGQSARLAFATRDVAAVAPPAGGRPARVSLNGPGLLGPEGPMPLHLTRWVLDRLSQRWFAGGAEGATADATFLDFADMAQHRQLALHYRAWADCRPEVQAEREGGGRPRTMLAALAGTGLGATADAELDALALARAAELAHQAQGPERLTGFLAAAVGAPVSLREFVGAWTPIPAALQTRLGRAHAGLGRGATLGPRAFRRQDRIELGIGPLGLAGFERFLPGGDRLARLGAAARRMLGEALDVAVRLRLRSAEIPSARIGAVRLGRTAWIAPRRDRDAELRLGGLLVGWRPER